MVIWKIIFENNKKKQNKIKARNKIDDNTLVNILKNKIKQNKIKARNKIDNKSWKSWKLEST